MNLFDLPGPEFLMVWCVGAAGVALATLVLRVIVARPRSGDVGAVAASLTPTEVAYLEGDRERAIEAAVAGLVHRGVLVATGSRIELVNDKVVRGSGVYRGVVDNVPLDEVEAYIVEATREYPATVAGLVSGAFELESNLRARLEVGGLLVDRHGSATWLLRSPAVAWLGVGGIKVLVGIGRDRPVAMLVFMLVAAVWMTSKIRLPRLTGLGRKVLASVRRRAYGLEVTAATAPAQVSGNDLALAYALFGGVAIGGAYALMMPSVQRHALLASTGTVGGGSSCGSSGGCSGGGCGGGGCGGGCGGCS